MTGFIDRLFGRKADEEESMWGDEPAMGKDYRKSAFDNIKEPRASFTVVEIEEGRIKVEFDWNKAFIDRIYAMGWQADTEEESVQLFFYASSMRPQTISEDIVDPSAPEIRLSNDNNRLVE